MGIWSRRVLAVGSGVVVGLCTITWGCSYMAFAPFGAKSGVSWDGNSQYEMHGWVAYRGAVHFISDSKRSDLAPRSRADVWRQWGIDPMPGHAVAETWSGFGWMNRASAMRERGSGRMWLWRERQTSVPLWLPAAVVGLPWVLAWGKSARRKRYRRHGRCAGCGYDLEGNVSAVCPECGRSREG